MVRRIIPLFLLTFVWNVEAGAQNYKQEFDEFRKEALKEYEDFRKECLQEYIDFLRAPWPKKESEKPIVAPKVKPVPPVVYTKPDTLPELRLKKINGKEIAVKIPKLTPKDKIDKKPVDVPVTPLDDSVTIDIKDGGRALSLGGGVIRLKKEIYKQPVPVSPIKQDLTIDTPEFSFDVFGTECEVRIGDDCRFKLKSVKSNDVADALQKMMATPFDNLLHDCLQIRQERQLSDWAYFEMLSSLVDNFYGKDTNEATLALAFLYMQSGYKMRLGEDGTRLYMLMSSRHSIVGKSYFPIDGENYYVLRGPETKRMSICQAKFPKESSLSLVIPTQQKWDVDLQQERVITSRRYPDFSFGVRLNKNLINFYDTYPTSTVNNNFMTRWAMYANAPMAEEVTKELYPQMKAKLKGLSNLEAMERLLNWVQTGFEYKFDNEVWGDDRAFFGEETLFYPYCDCEDRSILLSHLVRELLGLDTVLIYYPGHLAMAVDLAEASDGDYVLLDGRRFTVCDPTYIGARVGKTMPNMDNSQAKLILLEK